MDLQMTLAECGTSRGVQGQGMALVHGASRERSHLLGFGWPATDTVKQVHWL